MKLQLRRTLVLQELTAAGSKQVLAQAAVQMLSNFTTLHAPTKKFVLVMITLTQQIPKNNKNENGAEATAS